jgi:hypothetical protein
MDEGMKFKGFLMLIVPLTTLACQPSANANHSSAESGITMQTMDRLDSARIIFVHQSVGENIVEGLEGLKESSRLNIVDVATAKTTPGGFFAHAKLGKNGDPKGKTDAFVAALEGGLGQEVDIAFQKYCFVDIDAQTDVAQLFDYYRKGMDRLHQDFPQLRIVHVTAPLVHVQSGPRAVIKRWIGRTPDHYDDNAARQRFNALMRREYEGREPVFDLAALEASRPGQAPEPFQFRGQDIYELRPEYTTDGAHLNTVAGQRVAAELLAFLGRILPNDDTRPSARQ